MEYCTGGHSLIKADSIKRGEISLPSNMYDKTESRLLDVFNHESDALSTTDA